MRKPSSRMSWHTYGLIVAAVLSPAWLQVSGCPSGNPNLAAFEFEVDGVDQLNWVFGVTQYQVTMSSPTAVLRVQSVDPGAEIRYQWWADGVTYVDMWSLGQGDVEAEIDILEGYNLLRIDVRAPGGKRGFTNIEITNSLAVPYACTEAGLLDAIATGGSAEFLCDGPATIATTAELLLSSNVILDGRGLVTVDGNDTHRVFFVPVGVTAELRGLTITGGGGVTSGGAIYNEGALTLTEGTVTGNAATWAGGGLYNAGSIDIRDQTFSENVASHGAAMWNAGTATVTGTGFTGNTATGNGGGLYNDGSATVTESLFGQNTGHHGGGISSGNGDLALTDTMVVDNAVTGSSGGGILIEGTTATVTLANSTVSGNTAIRGGGIYFTAPGALTLTNTTVSGNAASDTGGGIYYYADGSATATNSTFRGNTAQADQGQAIRFINPPTWSAMNTIIEGSCDGPVSSTSAGWNIESPGDTCGFNNPTDSTSVSSAALDLGPLQYNGGSSLTHAPNEGSVAIDAIPLQGGSCTESTDQLGVTRPQRSSCDIGAVELEPHVAVCGDGTIELGEECDPPDGFICSAGCQVSYDTEQCVGIPDGTICDFGVGFGFCQSEVCQPWGSCAVDADCDDGNECTEERCDPLNGGSCLAMPDPANGRPCGYDTGLCHDGVCNPGGPVGPQACFADAECNDDSDCTSDWCDFRDPGPGGEGVCSFAAIPGEMLCDSGAGVCRDGICDPSPEWGPVPQTLYIPFPGGTPGRPDIAMDAAGNAFVVWLVRYEGSNCHDIRLSRYDVERDVWELSEEQFRNCSDGYRNPRIAMNPSGDAMLVYEQRDLGLKAQRYSKFDDDWRDYYSPLPGTHNHWVEQVDVEMSYGSAMVVWSEEIDILCCPPDNVHQRTVRFLYANRYDSVSGWEPEAFELHLGLETAPAQFQMTMNDYGHAKVMYVFGHSTYSRTSSQSYYSGPGGYAGAWAQPEFIDDDRAPVLWKSQPDIAMDNNDNAIAVWTQVTVTPKNVPSEYTKQLSSEIWWNRFDPVQSAWVGASVLATDDTGFALSSAHVAMDNSGHARAVYRGYGLGEPWFPEWNEGRVDMGEWRYSPGGGTSSPYGRLDDWVYPQVAMGANGNGARWAIVANNQSDSSVRAITPHPLIPDLGLGDTIGGNTNLGKPQLAMNDQGHAIAAWWENSGSEWHLMASRFAPPTGNPVTTYPCSELGLRQAVAQGGTALFDCGDPIVVQDTLVIDKPLRLAGDGRRLEIQAAGELNVFQVGGGVWTCEPTGNPDVLLENLAVTVPCTESDCSRVPAIENTSCHTVLENVTISGAGRAIYNQGSSGWVELRNSTVSGARVGGIYNGGGTLHVDASTISGNESGLFLNGAGLTNYYGDVQITNSTISGNTSAYIVVNEGGDMRLTHCTIARNSILAQFPNSGDIVDVSGTLHLSRTLIDGGCFLSGATSMTSGGYNIQIGDDDCGLSTDSTSLVGVDPAQVQLSDLKRRGLTEVHLLLPLFSATNRAIDHIPFSACVVTIDQRGSSRPYPPGGSCDVGAVEMDYEGQ